MYSGTRPLIKLFFYAREIILAKESVAMLKRKGNKGVGIS
jgi:hypothetical protein